MSSVVAIISFLLAWAAVLVWYFSADIPYRRAVDKATGRDRRISRISSPAQLPRAVNADLAEMDRNDALAASGQLGPEIDALRLERARRLRVAIIALPVISVCAIGLAFVLRTATGG